jgi:transcriptional accessory protein Tex/SPT6
MSKVASEWKEQRRLIIRDALHKILLPVMESEARSELSQRAQRFVVGECEKSLWRLAARAPYARKKADPDVSVSLWGDGWLRNEGFDD